MADCGLSNQMTAIKIYCWYARARIYCQRPDVIARMSHVAGVWFVGWRASMSGA
jgi:hypothetical protein